MKTKNHKLEKKHEYKKKENGLNATGRPTKYNEEVVTKSMDYIDNCEDMQLGLIKKVNLPMICELANCLKVNQDTLYEWAEEHKEFSDILVRLRQEQEKRLINSGLSGAYNSAIAKLILAKHGYVEKQEVTGKDGAPLSIKIISYTSTSNSK